MLIPLWNRLLGVSGGLGALTRAVGGGLALAVVSTGAAGAIEVIDSAGGTIYVEVNKGRLIRLDEPPATVFLANPAVADLQFRSSRLVYLFGLQTGETSLFALDKNDQVLLNRKIIVGYDLDQLNAAINALIPNSSVSASMINTTLVLDGVVSSPAQAQQVLSIANSLTAGGQLLNRISVSMPNQVNLRVKIAEVERNVVKDFGLNLSATGGTISFSTTAAPAGGSRITLNKFIGTTNIDALVSALETEGLVTVLAEPNLTAVSGQTASFLAGGEIPFATEDADGNTTVAFREFGVSLTFTPTITDDSRISLKVTPEVSQVSATTTSLGGNTFPALSTRRADTTVELGNGESLALGGLLQRNVNTSVSKVPGLGDLPILGTLFRSRRYQRNETELMIIVTPYIVRPTSERLAAPTDGFESANDYEQIVWGTMYRDSTGSSPDRVSRRRGQRLIGPVGYQIE